jgi:hypothetical protein
MIWFLVISALIVSAAVAILSWRDNWKHSH